MLVYLGHLVRQCNWTGETANTGVFASEGLQIVMCLLDRLNMGETLLKYECTVATALLCQTAWHTAMPGQAFAEEFCESLLSSLVTKKGQDRGAVTIEDVDDLYHLITIRKEGHRVNVCKIPDSFVNSGRQRLTAYLNAEGVYVPWARWCAEPTCTIQVHWPRRGVPNLPPSVLIPKGSNHYKQVLVSVLLVLTQQGPLKAGFKRKLSELIPSGRAVGGGTAPDLRRPSQRWKAPPPGTPFRHPHSEQRRPARAHAVGPVLGPHARTDRTRDTRVAEPWPPAPEDGRPGKGQRLSK